MGTYARAAADALHDSTKHGTPPGYPDRLVRYQRLDPANAPAKFKRYRELALVPLPKEVTPSQTTATQVLSGEVGDAQPEGINSSLLATLLYLTGGVTRTSGSAATGRTYFRSAMSAGNLHPVELYVMAGPNVDGIPAGVHHFAPREFGLTELRRGEFRSALDTTASLVFILTGLVWRTTWKYGERGWRHLYWDAGAMLANLLAVADAHGLKPSVITAFDDELVARLVGVDGVDEVPLALVTLGSPSPSGDTTEQDISSLALDVAPVARSPFRLPLLTEAQAEGALSRGEVADWGRHAAAVGAGADPLVHPPGSGGELPIETVILQRGSTRVMRRESVASEALTWPMAAATRAVPWDVGDERTLLSQYLSVHGVNGVAPGAYRWTGEGPVVISESPKARAIGAALCLDQPLGGDSAYTAFHHADLASILDGLGSRGYRAAQLEAGIVSGRLALCAFALGLGATGLTFFDDPVSDYFETSTAPMLVTSVGVSETHPAPAGSPGEPVQLGRYDQVMRRMAQQLRRNR